MVLFSQLFILLKPPTYFWTAPPHPPPPRRHKMKYSILIFLHHLSVLHNPTFFIVNHMTSLRQHIHVTPSGKGTFFETVLEAQTS